MTDHTLFTLPLWKLLQVERLIICKMWFERLADEWIATSSRNFVAWLSQVFQRSVPYDILHWFPASGRTRNFRLDYIKLPWDSLYNYNHFLKQVLTVYQNKIKILFMMSQNKHTLPMNEKSTILMLMNQNQAYSCLCPRIKHTHAYDSKPSILMLVSQKRYIHTTNSLPFWPLKSSIL